MRAVTVNNGNPENPGGLGGALSDQLTGGPVANATVTVKKSGIVQAIVNSDANGLYQSWNLAPGSNYSLSISATGYETETVSGQTVFASSLTSVNAALTPIGGAFRWGDVSADARVGTIDASQILEWIINLRTSFPIDPSIVKPLFPEAADVTGDAMVGTTDAAAILQHRIGLIGAFATDTNGDGIGPEGGKSVNGIDVVPVK